MEDVVSVDAVRSPSGRHSGGPAGIIAFVIVAEALAIARCAGVASLRGDHHVSPIGNGLAGGRLQADDDGSGVGTS